MVALPLICHRSTPSDSVAGIDVAVRRTTGNQLHFRYVLRGDIAHIALPAPATPQHADGLWRHTCFEAFISTEHDSAYVECNFSPSSAWATYRFARYRSQMTAIAPLDAPHITMQQQDDHLVLEARLQLSEFADVPLRIGVTAVVEDDQSRHSYWALRHPSTKPDFHHRSGFILRLAETSAPSKRNLETQI